jgi:hypothetical protein
MISLNSNFFWLVLSRLLLASKSDRLGSNSIMTAAKAKEGLNTEAVFG